MKHKRHLWKLYQWISFALICMGIAIIAACPYISYLMFELCRGTKWFVPILVLGPLCIDAVAIICFIGGDKIGD